MPRVFSDEGVKIGIFQSSDLPLNNSAIKVSEFADFVDLSDLMIVDESEFVQADSDEITRRPYSSRGKVAIPTTKNYTGHPVLFRTRTVLGVPDTDDPMQYFDDRQEFLLLKRKGVPEATAWLVGQDYEWMLFRSDAIKTPGDDDGGFEVIDLPLKQNGGCGFGVVVAS